MEKNIPLTPKKIQRLMYLAEDKSFNSMLRPGNSENNLTSQQKVSSAPDKSANYDLSSGLLDLERCEAFGESINGNLSLSKSTTSFHHGEMTGRSTGADQSAMLPLSPAPTFSHYGRFSEASLQCLEKKMDQQTSDVQQIMRQSIASGYSFHSKRDLTADEVSLVMREAPVNPNHINMDLKESTQESDPIELSMGSYFQNRCLDFKSMLPGTLDSPSRDYCVSLGLSMVEDPPAAQQNEKKETSLHYSMDTSLDSVPVRQPRNIPKMADISNAGIPKPMKKATEIRDKPPALPPFPLKQNCFLMDPSKQHLRPSLHPVTEESARSEDDSLSISNIRGLLEKESNADIDALMKYMRLVRMGEKQALTNLDLNSEANRQRLEQHSQVTLLKDAGKTETASSAGTIDTVINTGKQSNQENAIPEVLVTRHSLSKEDMSVDSEKRESIKSKTARSKSPSSHSRSTLSTVQENLGCSSFKSSSSSPMESTGVAKSTHNTSPYNQYKELDKSVDWQELLQAKGRLVSEGLAKDNIWAEIKTVDVTGFVGVSTPAVIAITSLTDTWLTARLEFNLTRQRNSLSIDLPRFPILLPPGRTEHFTVQVTSNTELNDSLPFTLYLKDSSIEGEVAVDGSVEVLLRMPTIQAISSDRVNKVTFPPAREGMILNRSFVLISDCPVDLQLDLTVTEGSNMFTISSVQEIKKADVTKQLIDCQPSDDKQKYKTKGLTRQLCRLSNGNAIKVTLRFSAPKLADLKCDDIAVLNGALEVNLIGINILLKKVDFVATVGTVKLALDVPSGKVNLSNETTFIAVRNEGTVTGTWMIRFKDLPDSEKNLFRLSENNLEIFAGTTINLKITYQGHNDHFLQRTLIFEDAYSGTKTQLEVIAGQDAPKVFPIKTSCNKWSWVRNGRKEISLKNFTDKKVHLKCKIVGDAFYLDLARGGGGGGGGVGPNTITQVTFAPLERRSLPVVFHTNSTQPCTGALYLSVDRDTESRKVFFYGASTGEALCWSGALVTYGNTALVRAISRRPVELTLANRSTAPAFLSARVHFNLQYRSVAATSAVAGGARVVRGRGAGGVTVAVDWGRVERCAGEGAAAALATVTLLTGAELTRRRILRALKHGTHGELDISSIPEHLRQLVGPFEGEDPCMDDLLADFQEDKSSLDELVKGIHELTAQIDLPQDFPEDNTILITDDTVLEHHTLAE